MNLRADTFPAAPRAASSSTVGVDAKAKIIHGYIVAEIGEFKTEGRGQFDGASLDAIVRLMQRNTLGTLVRYTHGTFFEDAIGSFLGRARNPRRDGAAVRADLHLDPSAFVSPRGDLGTYILTLAKSDPTSFGSSLVLDADKVPPPHGSYAPPIWRPTSVFASDIVFDGDAVHSGFLSPELSIADLDRWLASVTSDRHTSLADLSDADFQSYMEMAEIEALAEIG